MWLIIISVYPTISPPVSDYIPMNPFMFVLVAPDFSSFQVLVPRSHHSLKWDTLW